MEIINRKKFAKAALNKHIEAFMVDMTFLLIIAIHSVKKAQIALLVPEKVQIPSKYSDFSDVLLEKKALILPKATKLNQYTIKLQKSQQSPYESIYSLDLVELKILKIYIKTNLANGFIWSLKSPANAFILFVGKSDSSFHLYLDYWGLNNLTIKNRYPPPLIDKLLDRLSRIKKFI